MKVSLRTLFLCTAASCLIVALFSRLGLDGTFPVLFGVGVVTPFLYPVRLDAMHNSAPSRYVPAAIGGAIGLGGAGLIVAMAALPAHWTTTLAVRMTAVYSAVGAIGGVAYAIIVYLLSRMTYMRSGVHTYRRVGERGAVIVTVACIGLVSLAFGRQRFPAEDYRGTGVFTDRGYWEYPRFHIECGAIELGSGTTHVVRLDRIPVADWTIKFKLRDGDMFNEQCAGLVLNARLVTDGPGAHEWEVNQPLSSWELAKGSDLAIWHSTLRDIRTQCNCRYTLYVTGTTLDGAKSIDVVPIIEGGGNEIPK